MAKKGIVVSKTELVAYELIQDYLHERRDKLELSDLLQINERTVRRKAKRVQDEGLLGLRHKNEGRTPANKRNSEEVLAIQNLVRTKYFDFNISHTRYMLNKDDKITISYGSLRTIMTEMGFVKRPKRRRTQQRTCRDRMPRMGMMLQMDGSPHRWNGKDEWCLIGAIDDATSHIPYAEFFHSEDTLNCMRVLQKIVDKHGIPEFLYVDRAGLYGGMKRQGFSQFKRACDELGIKVIFANSPQAKGRIERSWQTLQDRLVAEMRLHNITHMPAANAYLQDHFLPEYWDKELTVIPAQPTSQYRKIPEHLNTDDIFCIKFKRKVNGDATVSIDGDKYRIKGYDGGAITSIQVEVRKDYSLKWTCLVRGQKCFLERIESPVKGVLRSVEPCVPDTASEAPGEGTRLREGSPQARARAVSKPAPPVQNTKTSAGGECSEHPQGMLVGGKYVSVLKPSQIPSKPRWTKSRAS